ncbi:MAG: class I SAM-dependent methyltransferase [Ruminococcus sp.]|nr:class I SAM-dependent methyltransferase [Ruminococcus sp.]
MPVRDNTKIWNFYAPVYNMFMLTNRQAYQEMYQKISKTIQNKKVLELACGTGLISNHVAEASKKYIATDFAENMLIQAQKKKSTAKLHYMKADASALPFANKSFDVVIISNALHVIPNPEKVLSEIARVLKTGGILIAPNFIHENLNGSALLMSKLLTVAGITFETKWNSEEYVDFLKQNRFYAKKKSVLKASIPLMYVEANYK